MFKSLVSSDNIERTVCMHLIATKNFKEVAWVLARLAGVNSLEGGVAGAAAALVGAGAWCATPFAS